MKKSIKKFIMVTLALTTLSMAALSGCTQDPSIDVDPEEEVHLEHKYTDTVTPSTCTTGGSTKHTCEVCGFSFTDSITPPNGHTPGEPVVEVLKASSCTEEGKYTESVFCSVCNEPISGPITKISSMHRYVDGTCTECGTTLDEEAGFSAVGFKFDKSTNPTTLSRIVSNADKSFDLNKAIKVGDDCVWKLYSDENCTQEISEKVLTPLTVGHNTAYMTIRYAGDSLYTSKYAIDIYRLNKFNYSFVGPDGRDIVAGQVEESYSQYPLSNNPVKTNYDFAYWAVDGQKVEFPYAVTKNVRFEAVYTPTKYKINYVLNGGGFNGEYAQAYDYETAVELKTPVKENYGFDGWYTNSSFVGESVKEIPKNVSGDKTYYAKWTADFFKINYELNGGEFSTVKPTTKFTVEEKVSLDASPVKAGFSFAGWYLDSSFRESTTEIKKGTAKDVTLYAKWAQGTEGLSYALSEDGSYYTLVSYTGKSASLVVPDKFLNIPVKEVKASAFKENTALTSVTLSESIVSVGDSAFEGCSHLNLTLPDSIKSIGKNAFRGCALQELSLPEGLTNIGARAFADNASLTTIDFNSTELTVGSALFENCPLINTINIGTKVTKIPDNMFAGISSLREIAIPSTVTVIGARAFFGCNNLTELNLHSGITEIGLAAFGNCSKLQSITLPFTGNKKGEIKNNTFFGYIFGATSAGENKTSIPESLKTVTLTAGTAVMVSAFSNCDKVETINLPNTITQIGNSAFFACNSLTAIDLPDGVEKIGSTAYQNCAAVSSLEIPDSVIEIGKDAFSGCSIVKEGVTVGLQSVRIGAGITKLPDNIFKHCTVLNEVNFASNSKLVEIGAYAFNGCSSLENFTIPDTVKTIGTGAFQDATALSAIIIPDSVKTLNSNVFFGCVNLANVTLSSSLENVQVSVFNGCKSLTSIDIPANIKVIGALAFSGCTQLSVVTLHNGLTAIDSNAFRQCESLIRIENIVGLQRIGAGAFFGCKTLTNVYIPSSVTEMGGGIFEKCDNLETLEIPFVGFDKTNVTSKSHFGFMFGANVPEDNGNKVPASLKTVKVTGGTDIVNKAFFNCANLVSITLPDTTTSLGVSAFNGCVKLENFILTPNITSIGNSAFKGCTSLSTVTWNSINATASTTNANPIFENCTSLATVAFATDVESIPAYAFCNNTSLINVTINSKISAIGNEAFKGCVGIGSLTLSDELTSIGDSAFEGCSTLGSIIIPEKVATIGAKAFAGCVLLDTLEFAGVAALAEEEVTPKVELTIGSLAFENSKVSSLVIPDRTVEIGSSALKGCVLLENLTIPFVGKKVVTVASAESLFGFIFGTTNYTGSTLSAQKFSSSATAVNYYIPTSLKNIVVEGGHLLYGSFNNCSKLQTVDVTKILKTEDGAKNNTTQIGENAFLGCTSLTSMTIPSFVNSIGVSAFSGCSSMTALTFESGSALTVIGNNAFQSCSKLQGVAIPATVTSIGASSFDGNTLLASLTFDAPTLAAGETPANLTIGSAAFQLCTNLVTVVIPDRTQTIESGAFSGCSKLANLTLPFIGRQRTRTASANQVFGYIFGTSSRSGATSRSQYNVSYYIPNSLTDVSITGGDVLVQSFVNCANIVNITLPENSAETTIIEESAFKSCSNLAKVAIFNGETSSQFELPKNTTSIGDSAFSGCTKLTEVNLPATVTSIGASAFEGCTTVATLRLAQKNKLTTISNKSFKSCTKLVNIDFGSPIDSQTALTIGDEAFNGCNKLQNTISLQVVAGEPTEVVTDGLVIPAHVSSIGINAFLNCTTIKNFSIAISEDNIDPTKSVLSKLSTIGNNAFDGCTSLASVDFGKGAAPLGVETALTIGNYAFRNAKLTSLNVLPRVTSIGENAFQNNSVLASINVLAASRLTTINNYAFSGCTQLVTVTIVDNVLTKIGDYAFAGCSNLTAVNFGTSPATTPNLTIGAYAFQNCYKLRNITIPDCVSSMGQYLFAGCYGLETMTIPFVGNTRGTTANNACVLGYMFLNSSYSNSYSAKQYGTSEATYYIPNSLTKVVVTGGNILSGAFDNCNKIQTVALPDGITAIGSYAFRNCTSLTKLNGVGNPDEVVRKLPSTVTKIDVYAFQGCTGLSDFELPNGLSNMQNYAFSGCTNLEKVKVVVEGAEIRGLPDSLTILGSYAFQNCTSLSSVSGDEFKLPEASAFTTINEYAFTGCTAFRKIIISDNIKTINQYAFSKCTNLQVITLSKNLQTINQYSFLDCSGLSGISIPATVATIGKDAFQNCTSLAEITFEDKASGDSEVNLTIATEAFKNCIALTSVNFPDRTTLIETGVLNDCKGIATLELPFAGKNRTKINSGSISTTDAEMVFGHIFGTTAPASSNSSVFATIKQYYTSSSLTTVYIPVSLKTVVIRGGNLLGGVFDGMTMIENLTLPKSTDTNSGLGTNAFRGCTSLKSIKLLGVTSNVPYVLPQNITDIGQEAFNGCTNGAFTELQAPVTLTKINTKAFYKCSNLTTINLSNCSALTIIDANAFEDCTELVNVTLPANLTSINNYAFCNTKINTIIIPAKVSTIGTSAFERCSDLRTFTILNEVSGISPVALTVNNYAFRSCDQLTEVTIPARATAIGTGVFADCSHINKMTLAFAGSAKATTSDGSTMVFGNIFGNTAPAADRASLFTTVKQYYNTSSSYATVYIPNVLREVILTGGNLLSGVFDGMSMLTSITLPSTVNNQTAIGSYAFRDCTSLISLKLVNTVNATANEYIIPENITQIGAYAFYGCNNSEFKTIKLPNTLIKILNDAFYGCTNLTSVNVPSTAMTDIGVRAFAACPYITTMSLPFTGILKTNTTPSATALFGAIFASTNPQGASETPVLYNEVTQYYSASSSSKYYIPKTLTSVTIAGGNLMFGVFDNMSQLTTLNLPTNVNNGGSGIGQWAFRNCNNLSSFTLPTNIQSIGVGAFANCDNAGFTTIVVPDSVSTMGTNVFIGCPNLTTITLPFVGTSKTATAASYTTLFGVIFSDTAPTLGEEAKYTTVVQSYSTTATKTYYIPNVLKTVTITGGNFLFGAFDGMSQLTKLNLPQAVSNTSTAIGQWAFRNCSNLTEIAIPANVQTINEGILLGCSSLTKVTLPFVGNKANVATSRTSVFGYVFSETQPEDSSLYNEVTQRFNANDASVSTYYIPKSLTSVTILGGNILYGSFDGMSQLTSLTLPAQVVSASSGIGQYAFRDCSNLTALVLPTNIQTIGDGAFTNCSKITSLVIPNSVTTVGADLFAGCTKLVSVTMPTTAISAVPKTQIKTVVISGGTTIAASAFVGFSVLNSVTLAQSVTSIGASAFSGCTALKTMTIGSKTLSVADNAFLGCTLTSVTVACTESEVNFTVSTTGNNGFANVTKTYNPNALTA